MYYAHIHVCISLSLSLPIHIYTYIYTHIHTHCTRVLYSSVSSRRLSARVLIIAISDNSYL